MTDDTNPDDPSWDMLANAEARALAERAAVDPKTFYGKDPQAGAARARQITDFLKPLLRRFEALTGGHR